MSARTQPTLATLGWDDAWDAAFEPYRSDGLVPGRVSVQHRGAWDVVTEDGEVRARVPGRLRHGALVARRAAGRRRLDRAR